MADRPAPKIPTVPAGLKAPGKALWSSLVGSGDYVFRPDELAVIARAARVLDRIDLLETELAKVPPVTSGSMGQRVIEPLLVEVRSQERHFADLVARLAIPDLDGEGGEWDGLSASQRSRKAATARWHGQRWGSG